MKTSTYGSIHLTKDELGMPVEEVFALPWVEAGVAKVLQNRFGVEIQVGAYAGRLALGSGQSVDVEEMVPGTISACLALSTSGRRRGGQSVIGRNTLSPHEEVAAQFSTLCAEVLSRGPVKAYVQSTIATARPRGKIDVSATLSRLQSRGRYDLVQCRVRDLSDDTSVNRLLLAAACAAERILADYPLQRLAVRRSIVSLSGARRLAHPAMPAKHEVVDSAMADAVLLAETLLAGIPISPGLEGSRSAFSAWVNVDRLFEEAVRTTFKGMVRGARVVKGNECGVHLFHAVAGEPLPLSKRLDPDIVVFRDSGQTLVIDVKYRRSGEHPSEEQLYQLATHAAAFRAEAAALFVPVLGDSDGKTKRYGRLPGGCTVDVVPVHANESRLIETAVTSWMDSIPVRSELCFLRDGSHTSLLEAGNVSPST